MLRFMADVKRGREMHWTRIRSSEKRGNPGSKSERMAGINRGIAGKEGETRGIVRPQGTEDGVGRLAIGDDAGR